MITTTTETIDLTPDTLTARLAAWEAHRQRRLAQDAAALQLEASPDPITGGWAVRSPLRPGYVEIVTAAGCTCQEYAVRKSCPHLALIEERS